MAASTLVDGREADAVAVSDRAFHFGDGVFETMAVQGGTPLCWDAHLARLGEGCRRLCIPEIDKELIKREAEQLCGSVDRAVLKLIVTRGDGGRGYAPPIEAVPTRVLSLYEWPGDIIPLQQEGVTAAPCATRLGANPSLAGIKHLNRLENVLAARELTALGVQEGVMFDPADRVIEGTRSNLFLVRDGRLVTPDLRRCGVAGIVRGLIIDRGDVDIRDVGPDDLATAQEMFLCNSIIGIWPVRRYADRDLRAGPVAREILADLASHNAVISP